MLTIKTLNRELRERFNEASLGLEDKLDQKEKWVNVIQNSQLEVIYTKDTKEFRIHRKNYCRDSFVCLRFGSDAINEMTKYVQRTYSSNSYKRSWDSEGEIDISATWMAEGVLHSKKSKLKWEATEDGLYFKISDDQYGNLSGFFDIRRLRLRHERIINLLMTL